jgi:putative flippase GtrA
MAARAEIKAVLSLNDVAFVRGMKRAIDTAKNLARQFAQNPIKTTFLAGALSAQKAANAIGYASGTLLSFILNAKFNFRVTDRIALRLLSFFCVAALGYLASRGLLGWLIGDCGFGKYLSKAATLVVVVLLQYNLNRLISFRKS